VRRVSSRRVASHSRRGFVCPPVATGSAPSSPDVLGRVAPGDALVGEHRRDVWLLAGILRHGRHGAQPRDGGNGWRAERVPCAAHDLLEPGRRQPLVIEVAVDTSQEPPRPQACEPLVDLAARLTELRVAGVAEREHRVLQLLELRRLAADEKLDEGACIVGRIAIAVRAQDQHEQAFSGEIPERIVARRLDADGDAGGLRGATQPLGDALPVTGLRSVYDREPRLGLRPRSGERDGGGACAPALRALESEARREAGQPLQRLSVEPLDHARDQLGALGIEWPEELGEYGLRAHEAGISGSRRC
jgi:hypothetical protein